MNDAESTNKYGITDHQQNQIISSLDQAQPTLQNILLKYGIQFLVDSANQPNLDCQNNSTDKRET